MNTAIKFLVKHFEVYMIALLFIGTGLNFLPTVWIFSPSFIGYAMILLAILGSFADHVSKILAPKQ